MDVLFAGFMEAYMTNVSIVPSDEISPSDPFEL